MMRTGTKRIYFSIVLSAVLFLCSFLPWFAFAEQVYTLPGFFIAIQKTGGVMAFSQGNPDIYPIMLSLGLSFFVGLLYGIRTVCLLCKKNSSILAVVPRGAAFLSICIFFSFGGGTMQYGALVSFALIVVEAIGEKYLNEREEMIRKEKERRAKEILERADEKRRMYFPGRYTREFYRIIWKNFKYNWRNSFLFIGSGVLCAAFLFVVFALQNLLSQEHTAEEFLIGGGLQGIMIEAIILILTVNTFLMSFVFSYYIKSRIVDYQKFTVLGIRKKTMNIMLTVEYVGSLACAFMIGLLLGNVIVWLIRRFPVFEDLKGVSGESVTIYITVLFFYVLVSLVASAANYETYIQIRASLSVVGRVGEERPPRRLAYVLVPAGIGCIAYSIFCFAKRENYEQIKWIALFLAGVFLCLVFGMAIWVKASRRKLDGYYRHVLARRPFYYRYLRSGKHLFLLTMLHFLVLYLFAFRLAGSLSAQEDEQLYPYDFVCAAYTSDEEYFKTLQQEQEVELYSFPMIRMTTVKGSPISWMENSSFLGMFWPQGQNTAISESTYQHLKRLAGKPEKSLNLKGEELHIVYQQDRSVPGHPLDWYPNRKKPNIRVGQPLDYYHWGNRDSLYPERTVKSEEIDVLTGVFASGYQENLIVCSDAYFARLKSDGPSRLMLIKVGNTSYEEVRDSLEGFLKIHEQDSGWDDTIKACYDSRSFMPDMRAERLLKQVIYIFMSVLLTVCALFVLYMRFAFEIPELKTRYTFYEHMGMQESERARTLKKELRPFIMLPLLVGAGAALLFTGITFRLRLYDWEGMLGYAKAASLIYVGYFAVQSIWYFLLERYLLREAGVKMEERKSWQKKK